MPIVTTERLYGKKQFLEVIDIKLIECQQALTLADQGLMSDKHARIFRNKFKVLYKAWNQLLK